MYTKYPEVNQLVEELLKNIQTVLGNKLTGLYLYGSATLGDFDSGISDIDLLAATKEDVTEAELNKLRKMHTELVVKNPDWDNRIEVQYLSLDGLKNFRIKSTRMANISPGEPIHFVESGLDWLTNWYLVQTYGVTVFGLSPSEIVPVITKQEFIEKVKLDTKNRVVGLKNAINSKPYQGYFVMTMCRALYTLTFGEQVSKKKASDWAKKEFPQWSKLIDEAFEWRRNFRKKQPNPELTYPEVEKFVNFMSKKAPR